MVTASVVDTYHSITLILVNLNMIDTIGSGIKKMFNIQRHKFFPLPDYDLSADKVKAVFFGKLIDVNYAKKLAQLPELSLEEIMLLDKVAKQKQLSNEAIQALRSKGLIEGRRPNYHISSDIAKATNQEDDYIKLRGIENAYIQKIIIDYLSKFGGTLRKDLEALLMPKLSEGLSDTQKRDKIKNQLQELKCKKEFMYMERSCGW